MMQLIKNLSEPKYLLIVCILYTAVITFLLLVPINTGTTTTLPIDKLVHFLFNAVLVFLWVLYFTQKTESSSWKGVLLILVLGIFYGIIIEIFQEQFTTSRMADVWDVVANVLGCLGGLLVFKMVSNKFSS